MLLELAINPGISPHFLPLVDLWDLAACFGDEDRKRIFSQAIAIGAYNWKDLEEDFAYEGDLPMLQWAYKPHRANVEKYATMGNQLHILKWIEEQGTLYTLHILRQVLRGSSLEIADYFHIEMDEISYLFNAFGSFWRGDMENAAKALERSYVLHADPLRNWEWAEGRFPEEDVERAKGVIPLGMIVLDFIGTDFEESFGCPEYELQCEFVRFAIEWRNSYCFRG